MKKFNIVILIFVIIVTGVSAAEAGTGFSLFFPESFYKGHGGTISVENGLSTSIGLGGMLSVPIGFSYNKIQGYMVEDDDNSITSTKPWFMGDSFMGYAMLKGKLPLGPVFFEVYGGVGVNWNAGNLTAFEGNIAKDLAPAGEYAVITDLSYDNSFGYGWLAGASFGVTISKISVSVDFLYRDLKSDLNMTGTYDVGTGPGDYTSEVISESDAKLIIRGFTIGLGGSFAF
jgi:opacity protein-like surface antigen